MATYTIRKKDIDGNYQPETFTASTFEAIKKELIRDGTPWRRNWSVHTDNGCIFNEDDWQEALTCAEHESAITLKMLRECRGDAE